MRSIVNMENQNLKEHSKEVYYAVDKIIKSGKSEIQLVKNMIKIKVMGIDIIFILNCDYPW